MTANFLQNELQSLVQESKRKFPDTRTAAEKSLADLKSLSVTSESQLSGDLIRKSHFIDPFVFACKSRNGKLAGIAVSCLQRLANGRAIPRERLSDVLDALREIAALNLDVQLKILQTLPSLLQLYSSDIRGTLLAAALEICDTLQSSKTAVVSSTAEATFQQLVTTVYDRVSIEDGHASDGGEQSIRIAIKAFTVRPAAHDAFRVLADVCALANGEQPTFAQFKTLSPHFLLEVIGSIATNYRSILDQHPEQLEVCRSSLLPALNKTLATRGTFAVVVRALRIVYVLLRHHLQEMITEFEDSLLLMVNLLEPNASQPWKRVLCMEVFRDICSESSLFRELYHFYDDDEERQNVIGTLLGAFVRIASEDPTLIGLGRQSTMPSRQGDVDNEDGIASFEVSDIGGAVGGVVSASTTVAGLSTEWSSIKVPYLEQLDKSNLSDVPTTYIYTLVLNCISSLAEGLSRFVMPLSVPAKSSIRSKTARTAVDEHVDQEVRPSPKRSNTMNAQDYSRLINPLTLEGHPQFESVSSCARMLDTCWPPILATCSTFFNAALDADYYHNLVRAFQKLTQVSGVLELVTARDALLTSLSKAAVPPSTNTRLFSPSIKQNGAVEEAAFSDPSKAQSQSAVARDPSLPRLSVRNLLCLRALLNLGIALGPSLGMEAWFIILESLERAESLISSARAGTNSDDAHSKDRPTQQGGIRSLFGVEIAAVQTATKRMFESTSNYSDQAFALFITSLFKLDPGEETLSTSDGLLSPVSPTDTPSRARIHRGSRSISGLWTASETVAENQEFVISKSAELARVNMHRFLSTSSFACSWTMLVRKLLDVFASPQSTIAIRSKSASEVDSIVLEIAKQLDFEDGVTESATAVLKRCFEVFLAQLRTIKDEKQSSESLVEFRHKSHVQLLATLESVIGHCGDSLVYEWAHVLELISSTFENNAIAEISDSPEDELETARTTPRSEAILQRAFACLQLLVSDFLGTLEISHITELSALLFSFGSQTMVLNISLTTTTFFWNIASLLLETMESTENRPDQDSMPQKPKYRINGARRTWMLLFSRMSLLCLDNRSDVRQSSIRMTTKVLEAAHDQLSPPAWNTCILRLLAVCSGQIKTLANAGGDVKMPWQEAAVQTLTSVTEITVQNLREIGRAQNFFETWNRYVQVCTLLLDQKTLPVASAVFRSFASMLHNFEAIKLERPLGRAESVLSTCLDHHPADIDAGRESNQTAFTQYAGTLAAVLSTGTDLTLDLPKVVHAVERTVLECVHPPYTSDTKTLALEQEAVVALLPKLQTLLVGSAYIDLLQTLISAPLAEKASRTNATFVALASRCSDILRTTAIAALERGSELLDVVPMLEMLTKLIATKYTSLPQGGPIALWRNATASAVQVIQFAMQSEVAPTTLPDLTVAISAVSTSILQSGGLPTGHGQDIMDDELFDISSFTALHAAVVPKIGSEIVPATLLKSYVLSLFHASLITELIYLDLPDDLVETPLQGFTTVRPGTVCDPVYSKRNQICYTALDTLFSLVSRAEDGTQQSLRLAQIAAPYLLLRCAYTFKTFIADQPLRSISALPQPLRVEMLAVLNKTIELRCEQEAFAGISSVDNGDGKTHLRLLNGLFVRLEECWRHLPRKMNGVNWQDRKEGKEIEEALARWRACLIEGWEIVT
jgi:Dimerisation and cyclophilin-binding domain of Mon2/Guanine nucleotide exchange factor in Golgi transport N-terminal/C-terminal region of Mon2 protein